MEQTRFGRNRGFVIQVALLALAIAVGVVLRFYSLESRGLIYWDEAKFALEGVRLHVVLRDLLGSHLPLVAGKAIGTAKPTNALLYGVADGILGVHDYTPLLLNALCSTLAIAVAYLLGRRLFSPAVGLIAALLLATSAFDIIYARSALTESDAGLILLLGVLTWSYSWARGEGAKDRMSVRQLPALFIAGLLLGAAFTCNYRVAIYAGALVGFDLLWTSVRCWTWLPVRLPVWAAGVALVPALWQVIGVVARQRGAILFRSEQTAQPQQYWGQVLERVNLLGSSTSNFDWQQLQWYAQRQGWLMLALLVVGLAAVFWFRSFSWLSLAVLVGVPLVAASLSPIVVARAFEEAIPFTYLLIAAALVAIAGNRAWSRGLVALVLIGALILGTAASWQLTAERSGFRAAALYLTQHGAERVLTSSEVMVYYFRGTGRNCNAPRVSGGIAGLAADIKAGYRYAVLDYHARGFVSGLIRNHAQPVANYPMLGDENLPTSLITSEVGGPTTNAFEPNVGVYDLGVIHLPTGAAAPGVCVRDRTS